MTDDQLTGRRAGSPGLAAALIGAIACLACLPAAAQEVPTARQIWRHLPQMAGPPQEATIPQAKPAPRPAATAAAPAAARTTAPPADRDLSQARVVIHHPAQSGPKASRDLARRLRAAGAGEVEIREVGFAIGRRDIRYFHASDRALSRQLDRLIGLRRNAAVSDFTHFRPLPRNGTVEVWLP
ncbi:hypothetical protein [Paracoccus spongiarum]|uniref:LytR/CpsA/Psr regulator C-terminal domain-containing protein n=1 Tax=Paracoccus spongiarum TaxID=3064387 RepID=A0ABT9JFQ6_9RHOB|nr:hypothetical protein [Paracoccus sp. 2205BS29-5]MDP5308475.1 hypothetical protein [Paracoccus sp. 2205BS29-5]